MSIRHQTDCHKLFLDRLLSHPIVADVEFFKVEISIIVWNAMILVCIGIYSDYFVCKDSTIFVNLFNLLS
jgi:hypothetical protein